MAEPQASTEKLILPRHLGLILDGNRRWARSRGLPTLEGHKAGYDNLKVIAGEAFELGIRYVSAYIFSTENWDRSKEEVGYLMNLILTFFKRDALKLSKEGIRIEWLGVKDNLDKKIIAAIDRVVNLTKGNTKGTLGICFNYGGYSEIVEALKSITKLKLDEHEINQQLIQDHLFAPDIPPLDLIIRTSGEQRLSNFMLWRAAYSELYFSDLYWPDFNSESLREALDDYSRRSRRFGK